MVWSIIQNKKEYERALARIEALSQNPPTRQSNEGRELMLLGHLVDQYEEKEFPIQFPDPIDAIRARMDDLGLVINDLLEIFGDRGTASKVMNRNRALSLAMIRSISTRLSLPAQLLIQPTLHKKYSINREEKKILAREPKVKYKKRKK